MDIRVLVSDKFSEAGLNVLKDASGIAFDYKPGLSPEELCGIIGTYDGLLIRSNTNVDANVLASAEKLRIVGRAGIGVDNVDVPMASKQGIVVMNTPTGNAVTTAEHALALLMAVTRKIPQATASMRAGKWEKSKFEGREVASKVLGVVGLGNIGRIVAERAQGLRMRVIAFDPVVSEEKAASLGIKRVSLDELYKQADFITLHTPKTAETTHMINDAAFDKMKQGVIVINAARGGIVDEAALYRALEGGKVAGAGLDVFEEEPPPSDHPLLKLAQVVCTPHLGASTSEAQERVSVEIAEQVIDYLKHGIIRNSVNVPAVKKELAERLDPYFVVARRLGLLLGQMDPLDVNEFQITCSGEPGELGLRPIANAALAGYLQEYLEEPVNAISAPYQAKDRGIHVVEVRDDAGGSFKNAITVCVRGKQGERRATGTVSATLAPRLVGLDGYELEAFLGGMTLVMLNDDLPGVIGNVGTILGKHGTNVSRMQLGLDSHGGRALSIWNIDRDLDDETLRELRQIKNVRSVRAIKL
ncbi:MAG: phosphoglycerate dehydrogenase [Myxococcales bacterium]|nr:phosphoglycerate dehydrogenase [Myxococcales bacterium]